MSNLATQILVGGNAAAAIDALQRTANSVRETARIAGASAREQYASYQLSVRGIREEQEAADKAARERLASTKRIEAAWQREKVAQWQAVDAAQAKARADEVAALKADILARSQSNAASTARAYADTLRALGVESRAAAEAQQMLGESVGFGTAKMGYASASVRTLEGHIGTNTRAVERFISETLGLAPVLQAAFPIVGAVALVGMLSELAKKAYDAYQNIFNLKAVIAGLDQAEITVTQRVKQEQDRQEQAVEDILEKGPGGREASLRQHQQYVGNQSTDLTSYFYSKEFTSLPNDVKANYETLYKSVAPADLPDRLAKIKKNVEDLQAAIATNQQYGGFGMTVQTVDGFGPDSTRNPDQYWQARLKIAQQVQEQLEAQSTTRGAQLQAGVSNIDAAHEEEIAKKKREAAEAARAAQEAQRKADADHLRALEEQFELRKSSMTMRSYETEGNYQQRQRQDQANFWGAHLHDFAPGSEEYKRTLDQQQKALREYSDEETKRQTALQKMLSSNGFPAGIFAGLGNDKDTQNRLKSQHDAKALVDEASVKQREAAVAQDLQTGAITKYDAALIKATLHTEAYQIELAKLNDERNRLLLDETLNEPQRQAKLIENSSKIDALNIARKAQISNDSDDVREQTPFGAWKQALDEFVQQSRDTAAQVRDIWSSALSNVNEEIVKIISTRHNYNTRVEFGNIGAGIFRNIAGAGLGKAEGTVLGALGFGGKPDGSQSKPFYMILAGAGSVANATGAVLSKAAGGFGGILGSVGRIFSGLGFADGGQPPIGVPSLVGENGPELFVPRVAGSVMPNGAFGGATHSHNWNIDARGATDPAAIHAAVQRGIYKAMPMIASATTNAQQNGRARMPMSRRS